MTVVSIITGALMFAEAGRWLAGSVIEAHHAIAAGRRSGRPAWVQTSPRRAARPNH